MTGPRRAGVQRIKVVVYLDPEDLERLDFIAAHYHAVPVSRSEELREAVMWLIARRTDWMDRRRLVERHRQDRAEDAAAALERMRERHPERFDNLERPGQPPGRSGGRGPVDRRPWAGGSR